MPDLKGDTISAAQFEASVREIARRLYSGAHATGAVMLDGRERDEIIDTGTELIIIEATKLRTKSKTEYDLNKSKDLIKFLKKQKMYEEYNFRIVLVTSDEPTADQNFVVKEAKTGCPKEIISFGTLFSRLFNGREYLRLRADQSFGSIRNPANESDWKVPPSTYIPTAMCDSGNGRFLRANDLADPSLKSKRFLIFGEYGSGKSMTLRDIYLKYARLFQSGNSNFCPVYINLRENIAQTAPHIALISHADTIGFQNSNSLISAWRAGYVALFLDGFDELTPPQFATAPSGLKEARRLAVSLVRNFLDQSPVGAPVFVAGRENYFDSRDEAIKATGFSKNDSILELSGFDDKEISRYLRTKTKNIPVWLPTRPLLLGYLANSGLLDDGDGLLGLSPTMGWDNLLDRICEREVRQIWGAGFDSGDLRLFIEGLSSRARSLGSNRIGLQASDLDLVYRRVFGRDVDHPANLLTSRLPGLGSVPGQPGAREFVDSDFADCAGAGDLRRFVSAPFVAATMLQGARTSLGSLGLSIADIDLHPGLSEAIRQASLDCELSVTVADLISMLNSRHSGFTGDNIVISDADFDQLSFDSELDFSKVTFRNCIFSRVEFIRSSSELEIKNYPKLIGCIIDQLEGVTSVDDLPNGVMDNSNKVERFSAFGETNDAIMATNLPTQVKVLLTILRKLFMQRGSGRQYSALKRGIPSHCSKYVEPITDLIKSFGFAEDFIVDRNTVLVPVRSKSQLALSIVGAPNTSDDPLIVRTRQIP